MKLTVVSDWHLGAVRSAGVTPASAAKLRQYLLEQAEEILGKIDSDLLVNGDLLDAADIAKVDLLSAYDLFCSWIARTNRRLFMANGNHDLDKNSTKLSSFQLLVELLMHRYPNNVTHITEGTLLEKHNAYVIPHVLNQDLFNLELAKVPTCAYLFVHANYDNKFAVESDHSLNVSEGQAQAAPVDHIIFGHEHKARRALGGKVLIVGNQFPSSVSDCLETSFKRLVEVDGEAVRFIPTWEAEHQFCEMDWRNLQESECRFIRVIGDASAEEAAAVMTTLNRYRAESPALVITNAVSIAGINDAEQLQLSHEAITTFSVRAALRDLLTEEENKKIDQLGEPT